MDHNFGPVSAHVCFGIHDNSCWLLHFLFHCQQQFPHRIWHFCQNLYRNFQAFQCIFHDLPVHADKFTVFYVCQQVDDSCWNGIQKFMYGYQLVRNIVLVLFYHLVKLNTSFLLLIRGAYRIGEGFSTYLISGWGWMDGWMFLYFHSSASISSS